MVQRTIRCQIEFALNRLVVYALFACGAALWPATFVGAQPRTNSEAEAVTLARQTLAASMSLPLERITASAVSPAQWRDSSLGCPQRGMSYTPALASGYEVKLRDGDRDHVVHVAGGRAVICSSQSDTKLSPAPLVSASLKAAAAVRAALAARLGVDPARIRIVSTRPSRTALPCAASPAAPKGAAFIVEAEAAARTFRYYADDAQALNCDRIGEDERQKRLDNK